LARFVPKRHINDQHEWADVSSEAPRQFELFSPRLRSLIEQKESESRRALSLILLGHFERGASLKEGVAEAYRDYESIKSLSVGLRPKDVLNYATFFWDFSKRSVMGAMPAPKSSFQRSRYIDSFLDGTDAQKIHNGEKTLADVRIDLGVMHDASLADGLRELAALNQDVAKKMTRELGENASIDNSRAFKHISAFTSTTVVLTRAASEMGASEEAAVDLGDYIEDMWDEIDTDMQDFREIEENELSPEDLYEENAEAEGASAGDIESP